jgi:hypothetical protein
VTHDHGGKADITLFHFSIKAQAARRKSLDERVPFHDKISMTASFTAVTA